jgi:putative flippase GtrA
MVSPAGALLRRSGVRQLIKFCIVGASSTVVDKGLLWALTKPGQVLTRWAWMPWWSWIVFTFCLGVTNGFIWNRRWTFRAQGHGSAQTQYTKFFATNAVGLLLNLLLTKLFLMMFTGQFAHPQNPDPNALLIANISAIPFVVIWNFAAAKYWTFRPPPEGGK